MRQLLRYLVERGLGLTRRNIPEGAHIDVVMSPRTYARLAGAPGPLGRHVDKALRAYLKAFVKRPIKIHAPFTAERVVSVRCKVPESLHSQLKALGGSLAEHVSEAVRRYDPNR